VVIEVWQGSCCCQYVYTDEAVLEALRLKVVEMLSENLQRSAEPTPSSASAPEPCRWFRSHARANRMFN
jgi:hypothetical protein